MWINGTKISNKCEAENVAKHKMWKKKYIQKFRKVLRIIFENQLSDLPWGECGSGGWVGGGEKGVIKGNLKILRTPYDQESGRGKQ